MFAQDPQHVPCLPDRFVGVCTDASAYASAFPFAYAFAYASAYASAFPFAFAFALGGRWRKRAKGYSDQDEQWDQDLDFES